MVSRLEFQSFEGGSRDEDKVVGYYSLKTAEAMQAVGKQLGFGVDVKEDIVAAARGEIWVTVYLQKLGQDMGDFFKAVEEYQKNNPS